MGMQTALTSFLLVRLVDALWASSIPFNISKFQKQLETELLCRSLVYRLVTPTTMDLAKRELAEGAPHGTVVLAEEMTSGRGRAGSKWISPDEGNLYVTIIFRSVGGQTEDQHQHLLSQLNFAAPLATAAAIEKVEPKLKAMIRWPRTIEVDAAKVSGSLIEAHKSETGQDFALGIGINVNADFCSNSSFAQEVTSMRCLVKHVVDREMMLANLCIHLEEYLRLSNADLMRFYISQGFSTNSPGSKVALYHKTDKDFIADGTVRRLMPSLNLVVETSNGTILELAENGTQVVFPRGKGYKHEL